MEIRARGCLIGLGLPACWRPGERLVVEEGEGEGLRRWIGA
jgi:hypothetical protein